MGHPLKKQESNLTQLIQRYQEGDPEALGTLMPMVYDQLKKIAVNQMRSQDRLHTLSATVLVHETFLKLNETEGLEIQDRAHFFAIASKTMRWFLRDYVRTKTRDKRGGKDFHPIQFEDNELSGSGSIEIGLLDEALNKLEKQDARLCQVVELRYLVGLTIEETAEILKVSPVTVKRDWLTAKAWLFRELKDR